MSMVVCFAALTQFCASPFYGPADALSPDNGAITRTLNNDPLARIVSTDLPPKQTLPKPVYVAVRQHFNARQYFDKRQFVSEQDRWLLPPTEFDPPPWQRLPREVPFISGYRAPKSIGDVLLPQPRETRGEWNDWCGFIADPNGSDVYRDWIGVTYDRPAPFKGVATGETDWLPKPEPFPTPESPHSSSR